MVRVAAQNLAQTPSIEQLILILTQVQRDGCPPSGLFSRLNAVLALPFGRPQSRSTFGQPGPPAQHRDSLRNNERGIKAHAKLSDQLRVLLLVAGQLTKKLLGP